MKTVQVHLIIWTTLEVFPIGKAKSEKLGYKSASSLVCLFCVQVPSYIFQSIQLRIWPKTPGREYLQKLSELQNMCLGVNWTQRREVRFHIRQSDKGSTFKVIHFSTLMSSQSSTWKMTTQIKLGIT